MCEDWGNATAISRAFNIGKQESNAVSNLQSNVTMETRLRLKAVIKTKGMRNFLHHEVIGRGLFNVGFSSASGPTEGWVSAMTNTDSSELVLWLIVFFPQFVLVSQLLLLGQPVCSLSSLSFRSHASVPRLSKVLFLIERMCTDWDHQAIKKAFNYKDALALHQSTAMFLHFLGRLKQVCPVSDEVVDQLKSQFLLGGVDPELQVTAEQSVPPGDLKAVGVFRQGSVMKPPFHNK